MHFTVKKWHEAKKTDLSIIKIPFSFSLEVGFVSQICVRFVKSCNFTFNFQIVLNSFEANDGIHYFYYGQR